MPARVSSLESFCKLRLSTILCLVSEITPCLAIIHRLQRRCRPFPQPPTRPLLQLVLPDSAVFHIYAATPTTTYTPIRQPRRPPTKPTIPRPPLLLLVHRPSAGVPVLLPAAHVRRLRVPHSAAILPPTAGSLLSPARVVYPGSLPSLNLPSPIRLPPP